MLSMQGKNAVVFGVANKRSIAWAIAQRLSEAGAKLALTYQNERMKAEAHDLITALPGAEAFQCDVSSDQEIDALYAQLKQRFGQIDTLVHSVAYAPAPEMHGDFLNTSREGFRIAHDVSVYSLIAVTRAATPLMTNGGSVITLSYFGAEKVVPGYNVMGVAKAALECTVRYLANSLGPKNIRVNAISAGPIKTLAASGISGFSSILQTYRDRAPLRRTVETSEVADAAVFLLGPAGKAITAEVLMVDGGYHAMGL